MIRGTTPNQLFKLNFLIESEAEIYITYAQNGTVILEKSIEDILKTTSDTTGFSILSFRLTQTETLLFKAGYIDIQIRIKLLDDTAIASDIIHAHINEILKGGEI